MSTTTGLSQIVLSIDSISDIPNLAVQLHFEDGPSNFSTSSDLPLSALGLTSDKFIFGSRLSPQEGENGWNAIEVSSMLDLNAKCCSIRHPASTDAQKSTSIGNRFALLLLAPSEVLAHSTPLQPMIKAVYSKYMASQELDDVTKEQPNENADLTSSSSSWPSSVSSTAYTDGVQVIGAMGGKGIEFHKPREQNTINLANASPNRTLFQLHPQISLFNMSVDCFGTDDTSMISLQGLQSLDLSSNFISSWPLHVGPILASSPDLQILNLSSNPILSLNHPNSLEENYIRNFAQSALQWLSSQSSTDKLRVHLFQCAIKPEVSVPHALDVPSIHISEFAIPSPTLTTLVLNKTGISWYTFISIVSSLPSLQEAHGCLNNWTSLLPNEIRCGGRLLSNPSLLTLNLDSNQLTNFSDVALSVSAFPGLCKLILSNNPISNVPDTLILSPDHPFSRQPTEGAIHSSWSVSLSSTHIGDWASLRNLSKHVPLLSEIRWQRNKMRRLENDLPFELSQVSSTAPAASSTQNSQPPSVNYASDSLCRHYVIALCPNVNMVNGSSVSELEHQDSERLYLVHLFSALAPYSRPEENSDQVARIETIAKGDSALRRIWGTQREATLDAFSRAFSANSGATGSSSSSGISMLDITLVDESGAFYVNKKLPSSTTIAKLRSIVIASFTPDQHTTFKYFDILLMEPSNIGPPSFHPLTIDSSTIAQETTRLKATFLIKPRRFKWTIDE